MMMLFYDEILPARSRGSNEAARPFGRTLEEKSRARSTVSSRSKAITSARVRAEDHSAVQTEQLQGRSTD
jgi:hypothetical protein